MKFGVAVSYCYTNVLQFAIGKGAWCIKEYLPSNEGVRGGHPPVHLGGLHGCDSAQ